MRPLRTPGMRKCMRDMPRRTHYRGARKSPRVALKGSRHQKGGEKRDVWAGEGQGRGPEVACARAEGRAVWGRVWVLECRSKAGSPSI